MHVQPVACTFAFVCWALLRADVHASVTESCFPVEPKQQVCFWEIGKVTKLWCLCSQILYLKGSHCRPARRRPQLHTSALGHQVTEQFSEALRTSVSIYSIRLWSELFCVDGNVYEEDTEPTNQALIGAHGVGGGCTTLSCWIIDEFNNRSCVALHLSVTSEGTPDLRAALVSEIQQRNVFSIQS